MWSLPMPTYVIISKKIYTIQSIYITLSPGWNLVPLWRTIMLPGTTSCPANIFTPNLLPAESLPLREEPPDFFVAQRTWVSSIENVNLLNWLSNYNIYSPILFLTNGVIDGLVHAANWFTFAVVVLKCVNVRFSSDIVEA